MRHRGVINTILRSIVVCICFSIVQSASAATARFILIPNEDGTTGAIAITSAKGSKLIKKAYTMVKVDEQGNFIIIKSNALCVDREFDDALAVIPKPKQYTLALIGEPAKIDPAVQSVVNDILAQMQATPIPFVVLTGEAALVDAVQQVLLQSKLPGLRILRDIVPASGQSSTNTVQVSVQ